jgi:hypothetical protein
MQREDDGGDLSAFLLAQNSIADLHVDPLFESMKSKYGKSRMWRLITRTP